MHGSKRRADPKRLWGEPWLEQQLFNESEMALFSECRLKCAQNLLTPPTSSEAIYHQVAAKSRPALVLFGSASP